MTERSLIFSGREDLKHKRIRILHNLSFRDDPTRILREFVLVGLVLRF